MIVLFSCHSTNPDHLYIEKEKPSLTPKIFAPNFISQKKEYEFGSVFSKDGTEFYYGVDQNGKAEIRYSRLENKKWTEPIIVISHPKYGLNDPFLSPDETELYYISDMPRNEKDTIKDYDIWFSKKVNNKWSAPINAGNQINTDKNEYYISFTADGKMYFSSNKNAAEDNARNFDIFSSKRVRNQFQTPKLLGDAINTKRYEADVFVAPDESYLIFCANRKEGLGRGDLYISFKTKTGSWTPSKNMGPIINSKNHELCPFVTHDGKYFFYTSNQDIYWVSTQIFEDMK